MALGRYPIPQPPEEEIEAEMKQPPAGAHQFRLEKNRYASHESAIRMPIFELLQIIFTSEPPTLPSEYFGEDIREFVNLCLQKDVKKRGDLKTLLAHKFIKNELSSSEFAGWVQRTIEANKHYQQL